MVSATMILSTLVLFVYNIYVRKYVMPYEYRIYTSANMLVILKLCADGCIEFIQSRLSTIAELRTTKQQAM